MKKLYKDKLEKAFPRLPATDQLCARCTYIFALADLIPPQGNKWAFDKVIALAVITFAVPLFALMWCAYKMEGLLDHGSRVSELYYDWPMSGGRKIKKLKVRALKAPYVDSQFVRQHDWRVSKGERNVFCRTWVGHFTRGNYLDELSQFWILLKGYMSSAGPWPSAIRHYERDLPQADVARSIMRGGVLR